MNQQVSVIIPAFNEENTIADVIRVAKLSPLVSDVLVVSDGSTDSTVSISKDLGVRVLELPENIGKGLAMNEGVKQTTSNILVFIDADLIGFTQQHLEKLILPVLHNECMMNVGIRDRGNVFTLFTHLFPLIGGERALRRNVFERINICFMSGFAIEPAMNYSCRLQKGVCKTVDLLGLHIRHKYQKVGFFIAVVQYIQMFYQISKSIVSVRFANLFGKFLTNNTINSST